MKIDVSSVPKETLTLLKNRRNIIGLSGGKDSTATCIILRQLDIPFETVTAEVWWKKDISGENPLHYEFMHDKLLPKLQSWGVKTHILKSKITAYDYMTTPIAKSSKHPERVGKMRGFPLCGKCGIQRDCKTRVCERFYKSITDPYNTIIGLASNEKDRILSANNKNLIALLSMLGLHEMQTFPICSDEKLLSPTYTYSNRGGCWFCPNQKIQELWLLYTMFPKLWEELMEVQRMPNKVQEKFNRTQTLYDIEAQIKGGVQMKFFMGELM